MILKRSCVVALSLIFGVSAAAIAHPSAQRPQRPVRGHQSPGRVVLSASPFIAADNKNTTEVAADVVGAAGHSLFHIETEPQTGPCEFYAGVLIEPSQVFTGLSRISFLSRGRCSSDESKFEPGVVVEYGTPGQIINRAFVRCSDARRMVRDDGFTAVEFTAKQFGLTQKSVIHKIVIADTPASLAGSFFVTDIRVNDVPVKTDVRDGTKFFNVSNCAPNGPIGSLRTAAVGGTNKTTLTLTNASRSPVDVFLTLGAAAPNTPCVPGDCVQDVTAFPGMQQNGGPLVGKMTLQNGASITYNNGQTIQGNFAFGAVFQNCPRPGFPNGMNYAEFTLNVPVGPNPTYPYQEAVDISCVAGVNADLMMAMTNSSNQPDTTWANPFQPVTSFENGTRGNNLNKPGVFPEGCDDCADRTNINPPPCFTPATCNAQHICNVQRAQSLEGGTVTITFKGFE